MTEGLKIKDIFGFQELNELKRQEKNNDGSKS
jgi:hypothetical protein